MRGSYICAAVVAGAIVCGAAGYGLGANRPQAVITLLGVVAAAIVTVIAASHRLDRQLDSASTRHEMELGHDRDLADLADLRAVLDDAAKALQDGAIALQNVREEHVDPEHAAGNYARDARNDLVRSSVALRAARARLLVRLGHNDELELRLDNATRIRQAALKDARAMLSPHKDPVYLHQDLMRRSAAYVVDERMFIQTAVARVGTARSVVGLEVEVTSGTPAHTPDNVLM